MVKHTTLRWLSFVAALTVAAGAAAQEFKYIKKDTREETRQATLAQYMPALDWGDWYLIGPFEFRGRTQHDVVYPPELGIDLEAEYEGKFGETVRWHKAQYTDFNPVDLRQFGDERLHYEAVGYLYREVTSSRRGKVDFHVGSDDGLKLWVNGRLVIDADVQRGLNVEDHRISIDFREGTNTILAKVTQGPGNWDFQMRPIVDSRIQAQLEYRLNIDFPESPEAEHYRIVTILEPAGVALEVGGLDVMPDGRPVVATRRGEVWVIGNAYDEPAFDPDFKRFAFGLHEPLGARWHEGGVLLVQRGELTKLIDRNGDDRADVYETVSDSWGVSGNYHEFAFGPKFDGEGRMWVTLNVGFCGSLGKSIVPWRGWALIINPDGTATPVCGGLRSPNGIGANAAGDMFFTDNQGDWIGTNKLSHMDFGDWHGHPSSFRWYELAGMPTPTGEEDFKEPAVWFPYGEMGQSASDIVLDDTGGKFGPFENQLFVGDQTRSSVMRVYLEKVDGEYQGACFPFRSGFDCGVNRMVFGNDGSMFVGMTNRGWGSIGRRPWGLQRLVYTGVLPFEIKEMRATPDGFELEFTKPVDPQVANDAASYAMESYTYERWEKYGSPEIQRRALTIESADVAADGKTVRLVVSGLRPTFVHELTLISFTDEAGEEILHDKAYYTLNRIPQQ